MGERTRARNTKRSFPPLVGRRRRKRDKVQGVRLSHTDLGDSVVLLWLDLYFPGVFFSILKPSWIFVVGEELGGGI